MVKRFRIAVLVLAVVGAASSVVPAATKSPGSITLTSPIRQSAAKGDVTVSWSWRSGTYVKSTSKVDVAVTQNGLAWYTIKVAAPIRTGTFAWSTGAWPDGVYAVRATVSKTSVKSIVSPMVVDNTAPEVRITRPAEGEVLVENERMVFFAAIVGTARLEADARDALSGVQLVTWFLDDEEIGTGTPLDYNFSSKPGQHVLKSEAVDAAGNKASHEITILVAPGPSAAEAVTPPDPSQLPIPDPSASQDPEPEPSDSPADLPELPDGVEVPELPGAPEVPTAPSPGPGLIPITIPTP